MTLLQVINDATEVTGIDAVYKITSKIGFRLAIDLLATFVLTRLIYYRIYKHKELFFTFFVFNLVIFMISFLLNKVELSMGAAFGLFAVFSMLRYRTEDISIKDMTYLFLVIAIGLISAVTKIKSADDKYEYIFLSGILAAILLITYLLESNLLMKKETVKTVVYENIEMIKEDRKEELMNDLKARTGLNIHRFTINKIDFLKDTAIIKIYFYEK